MIVVYVLLYMAAVLPAAGFAGRFLALTGEGKEGE
jgi:hypothetical protein